MSFITDSVNIIIDTSIVVVGSVLTVKYLHVNIRHGGRVNKGAHIITYLK